MRVTTQETAASAVGNDALHGREAYGVWSPAVTPIDERLDPDSRRFVNHVKWLLENGCHGVALFGSTGEATSFSVDERMQLLDAVVEAGVSPRRLMVGTGCCALTDSVRLTTHAVQCGCSKLLMLPPFYYKNLSDEAIFSSYAEVIERVGASKLRIFLYHFPKLSGIPITSGAIDRLLDAYPKAVAGVKDSSGNVEHLDGLVTRYPDLCIFPGTEKLLLHGLRTGAVGCITATANVNAAGIRTTFDAWRDGETGVDALQAAATSIRETIESFPMVPALKYLVSEMHDDTSWLQMRPPFLPLDEATARQFSASLNEVGFTLGNA